MSFILTVKIQFLTKTEDNDSIKSFSVTRIIYSGKP